MKPKGEVKRRWAEEGEQSAEQVRASFFFLHLLLSTSDSSAFPFSFPLAALLRVSTHSLSLSRRGLLLSQRSFPFRTCGRESSKASSLLERDKKLSLTTSSPDVLLSLFALNAPPFLGRPPFRLRVRFDFFEAKRVVLPFQPEKVYLMACFLPLKARALFFFRC